MSATYAANGATRADFVPPGAGRVPPQQSAGSTAAKGSLAALIDRIESVELGNQHDLYDFFEAYRMVNHTLAIYAQLAAGELEAAMKAAEKAKSKSGMWASPSARAAIRAVTREMKRMGEANGDSARHASAGWRRFLNGFSEALDGGREPKRKNTFEIV